MSPSALSSNGCWQRNNRLTLVLPSGVSSFRPFITTMCHFRHIHNIIIIIIFISIYICTIHIYLYIIIIISITYYFIIIIILSMIIRFFLPNLRSSSSLEMVFSSHLSCMRSTLKAFIRFSTFSLLESFFLSLFSMLISLSSSYIYIYYLCIVIYYFIIVLICI